MPISPLFASMLLALVGTAEAPPTSATPLSLTPAPRHVVMHGGHWTLPRTLRICLQPAGERAVLSTSQPIDDRLDHAARRLLRVAYGDAARAPVYSCDFPTLRVVWHAPADPLPRLHVSEAYTLDVQATGARIEADTLFGALHGMQSLEALLAPASPGARATVAPTTTLSDAPRFAWRGLLLDVARTYMPLPLIYRTLDAMAAVKMNVFHWHLTDDQGFRIESHRFPDLHRQGSGNRYYRQSEVREVVAYAARLGIRVVPEFDVPGHTASWLVAKPELASGSAPAAVPTHWGILTDTLDPTQEATYQFLHEFLGEMAGLFPDEYVHIGGDEVKMDAWLQNARIRAFMQHHDMQDPSALHAYFTKRVAGILTGLGKRSIGWDEVLQPGLPPDTVIQSWRGEDALTETLTLGHPALFSFGFYLDLPESAATYYANDPVFAHASAAGGEAQVLGGEACMWSELVGPENVERHLWPRAVAVAERLWSPSAMTEAKSFAARLPFAEQRLAQFGIDPAASQAAQLAPYVDEAAQADVVALLAYVEPDRANWWPGFRERRIPLAAVSDLATPDPASARLAQQAAQVLVLKTTTEAGTAAAQADRQAARQALLALFVDAEQAADRVLMRGGSHLAPNGAPAAAQDAAGQLAEETMDVARLVKTQAAAGLQWLKATPPMNESEAPASAGERQDDEATLKRLGVRIAFAKSLALLVSHAKH